MMSMVFAAISKWSRSFSVFAAPVPGSGMPVAVLKSRL